MTKDGLPQESSIFHSNTAVVVGVILLLIALTIAVAFLYESKLAPGRLERVWLESQSNVPEQTSVPLDDRYRVKLVRTRCLGPCPAYEVTVFGPGRVEFVGEAFVCEKHPAPTQITRVAVRRLLDGLDAVRFAEMPDYVRRDLTDNASATVILKEPDGNHIVRHYGGDTSAPRLLSWIESRIDEVAGSARWIGDGVRCNGDN